MQAAKCWYYYILIQEITFLIHIDAVYGLPETGQSAEHIIICPIYNIFGIFKSSINKRKKQESQSYFKKGQKFKY